MAVNKGFIFFSIFLILSSCSYKRIFNSDTIKQLEPPMFIGQMETDSNYYLLDIRTPSEYEKSHLDSAININFLGKDFKERVADLDPNKTVYLHCQTAHRSPYVVKELKKNGFTKIFDLKGGYRTLKK